MVKANPELLRDDRTGIVVPADTILRRIIEDEPGRQRTAHELHADVRRVARVLRFVLYGSDAARSQTEDTASPTLTASAAPEGMTLPDALLQVLTEDGAWWTCAELVDYVRGQRLTSSQVNAGSVGAALGALLKSGKVEKRPHESRRGQYQWRVLTPTPATAPA